jgi:malto-oligosyltrehalose trehalohydrolase
MTLDTPFQSTAFSQVVDHVAKPVRLTSWGAVVQEDGRVRFRLWAPGQTRLLLEMKGEADPLAMQALEDGWHEVVTDAAASGTRYRFRLEDGTRVPDPASRHQPEGVHGPSEVVDPGRYAWADGDWQGRPWEQTVLYELHVGTFTLEGTFRAVIERLDHLMDLGVTAIQLMPVADFAGTRNWGYDGVLIYAPAAAYGRPDDLKALVDAAHARGLMVFLDVVYNHFGPDGNYISAYAPDFFTSRHKTPWGDAINYDGAQSRPVRDFMIENALYWLEEFHFDGLRLDAVHAIVDDSPEHLLDELARRVRGTVGRERHIHLILENEENEAHRLERTEDGRPRTYTAQWNDDAHHVLHVAATGEAAGYYGDYTGNTERLGRALAEGFGFQGEMMPYRGKPRGEPSAHLPPSAFVAFVQNHDQVGNRAFGDRIDQVAPPEAVRALAAVYLLAPQIPMFFMGEEWAATQPFPFFCDFHDELGQAVREGRRGEFARFPEFQDEKARARIPDPIAAQTFHSAKLDWAAISREPHAGRLQLYRQLLEIRRREIIPRLGRTLRHSGSWEVLGDAAVRVTWPLETEGRLVLAAALSPTSVAGVDLHKGRVIWTEGAIERQDGTLGPWSVQWTIEDDAPAAAG